MNSDSDSNNLTCLDFHELESTFGESKSNIGTLRKNIIEVLMRFNRDILEDSISGFISEINKLAKYLSGLLRSISNESIISNIV
jgi:hypothetical protein